MTAKKKKTVDMTICELCETPPYLYIPTDEKARILRLWGGFTMCDFDKFFKINLKFGTDSNINCYQCMMVRMNETEGRLRDQYEKLLGEDSLADIFNILQSAVRSRIGEKVWYSHEN